MEDHPSEGQAGSRSWWRPALVALGVAAIGGGAYAVTASGADELAQSGDAPATAGGVAATETFGALEDLVVREGDLVRAEGIVIDGAGGALLCRGNPVPEPYYEPGTEPPPTCSALAVHLTWTDDLALPGWTERDGVSFTLATVVVEGTWLDGAIAVSAVEEAVSSDGGDEAWWEVRCAPPAGGWGRWDGLPTGEYEEFEAAMALLVAEMDSRPDRYHGRWIGYPDGDPFGDSAPTNDMGEPMIDHTVMMVSTVDEPAEVQAELAAIYPGNLCVTRVDHSLAELEAVVDRLKGADGWALDAASLDSSANNRATLELPVLDERAATRIGEDAELLEVVPLVRPLQ